MSAHEFYVGQKVICLNEGGWEFTKWWRRLLDFTGEGAKGPVLGDICTISRVYTEDDREFLELSEFGDDGFVSHYFRPIEEIEWARQICRDVTAGKTLEIAR